MENRYDHDHDHDYDHDQSSCGCRGIFCCIFPSSRDSNQTRHPAFPAPTKSTPVASNNHPHSYNPHQGNSRSDSDVNKAFSEYIDHAKVRIRATSNVGRDDIEIVCCGDSENKAGGGDVNDMFSDYITRAKMKIKKTSSIGSKRMISFRK